MAGERTGKRSTIERNLLFAFCSRGFISFFYG
jgi:hypothetical protein